MTGKSGQVTSRAEEEKHFYISDKRDLSAERRLLEVVYSTYPPMKPGAKTYFFEELDNGREWKDVTLYSSSSVAKGLDEFTTADRKYLSGIGVDPNVFPKLWGKDLCPVVDFLVPFLSKDKVER